MIHGYIFTTEMATNKLKNQFYVLTLQESPQKNYYVKLIEAIQKGQKAMSNFRTPCIFVH